MRSLQGGKRSAKNEKCRQRKQGENAPLHGQRSGEDASVTERPEPQQVNEIRQPGSSAEYDEGNNSDNEEKPAATPRRGFQRPVNRCGHCYPSFYSPPDYSYLPWERIAE